MTDCSHGPGYAGHLDPMPDPYKRCSQPCDERRCPNRCGYSKDHDGDHACTPFDVEKSDV